MKKIIILTAMLCFCTSIQAEPILPKISAIPDIRSLLGEMPDKEDFLKTLRCLNEWNENLNNPNFYYKRVIFHNRAGKIIKFKDLSEFDKGIFYITQGKKLTAELVKLQFLWKIESARLKDIDVHKYLVALTDLRKDTAIKYEEVIEDVFEKFSKEIPEQERNSFLKKIRELHDKSNLIKRENNE